MISYEPFWKTLKEKKITTYALIQEYDIAPATIQRLKHNKNITTNTISELCYVLDCDVTDILMFVPNQEILFEQQQKRLKAYADKLSEKHKKGNA